MHADKVVFTGEFELHRLVGRFGKHGGHVIVILRLILVTETTAHVLTDDPHFAQRQAEVFCDIGARVRNALRRSINGQLAGIPPGDADASLHLRIVDVLGDEGVFEDLVRFLESLFHISPGFFDGRAERPLADRQVPVWGNFRGIWFERFISVEHMRNFFIVDLDQFQRVFSAAQARNWLDGIYLFECASDITIHQIEAQIAELRTRSQSEQMMIIIDDCQRLDGGDHVGDTRLQIIAEQLQQTVRKLNLPVLAVWPDLASGSGALAQSWGEKVASPDVVLVMERDATRIKAMNELGQAMILHVVKNRGGEKGRLAYDFVPAFAAFTETP